MLESPTIIKIGHSFSGDVRMLNQTFKTEIDPKNLVEVQKMIKSKSTRGLKFMVNEYLQKDFCKFNQMSGWFLRPLRKSQIHYAALDAVAMIPIYELLKDATDDRLNLEEKNQKKKKKEKKYKKHNKKKKKKYILIEENKDHKNSSDLSLKENKSKFL